MPRKKRPVAIDLFAGAGGLTLGLSRAGFDVRVAVEQRTAAAQTYKLNNPSSRVFAADIRTLSAQDIEDAAGTSIDLLAACPPCQGFTSLTSKWRRDDPRNALVSEVARLTRGLSPRVVMLENVPRLVESSAGRASFDVLVSEFEAMGYGVSWFVADAVQFGTAQHRRRLIMYAAQELIEPPSQKHSVHARTVRQCIGHLGEPTSFSRERISANATLNSWHVVRNIGPLNLARLKAAKPGRPVWELPRKLRPDCHKENTGGFRNVYGRMSWDDPSPTITGGCTSPSKGRFGHPERDTTISVKEAALLQDFPARYRLATRYIDEACELIGNAFPARLAEVAARQTLKLL